MRERRDFSLLKLVHKALYMNNWPLALRSNQVTSLLTLRSSSATRLSNPHRSSGTICPVKYPALTLSNFNCHAKTYLFKQDFYFVYYIIYCIILFHFFFYLLLACKFLSQIFYLLVNFIHF